MQSLHDLVSAPRAHNLLVKIDQRTKELMPCGEQRIAALLLRYGAVTLALTSSNKRKYTTDYEITALGKEVLE